LFVAGLRALLAGLVLETESRADGGAGVSHTG
jgi:hypothetical protein